jgi:hypothetical protein
MDVNPDAFWLSVVTAVVFVTWTYHLYRSMDLWWRERGYRALRGMFIAIMLQVGLLRIWIGASTRAFPEIPWLRLLQDMTAPVLTALLLSGGVLLFITWKADDRQKARYSASKSGRDPDSP